MREGERWCYFQCFFDYLLLKQLYPEGPDICGPTLNFKAIRLSGKFADPLFQTMNDLLSVRLDLEALFDQVSQWIITRRDDVPPGWKVVSSHGDYVGLVELNSTVLGPHAGRAVGSFWHGNSALVVRRTTSF